MVEIKFNVKDQYVDDLKAGFLKAVPKPDQYQHLNDLQYFRRWLMDMTLAAYTTGKRKIAEENTQPEINDVLEE